LARFTIRANSGSTRLPEFFLAWFRSAKNTRQRDARRRNQPPNEARPRVQRLMRRCGRLDRAPALGFVLLKLSSQASPSAVGAASKLRIANLRRDSARRS